MSNPIYFEVYRKIVKSLFSCIFIPQKSAAAFGFSALNMPFPMSFRRTAGA